LVQRRLAVIFFTMQARLVEEQQPITLTAAERTAGVALLYKHTLLAHQSVVKF
jgi:hypothetical protein